MEMTADLATIRAYWIERDKLKGQEQPVREPPVQRQKRKPKQKERRISKDGPLVLTAIRSLAIYYASITSIGPILDYAR